MPVMVVYMAAVVVAEVLALLPVDHADLVPKALSSLSMSRLLLTHWSM
jgi:hypothetical protein